MDESWISLGIKELSGIQRYLRKGLN